MIIMIFGIPLAALIFLSFRGLAWLEGRIVEALLGVRMPRRPVFAPQRCDLDGKTESHLQFQDHLVFNPVPLPAVPAGGSSTSASSSPSSPWGWLSSSRCLCCNMLITCQCSHGMESPTFLNPGRCPSRVRWRFAADPQHALAKAWAACMPNWPVPCWWLSKL